MVGKYNSNSIISIAELGSYFENNMKINNAWNRGKKLLMTTSIGSVTGNRSVEYLHSLSTSPSPIRQVKCEC
jgi:hypothetical protein